MLILETPTYDTLSFKILGSRERSLRCDGHLSFFTRKTLGRLVESCGLKVIKQEQVGRTLTLGRLLTRIGMIIRARNVFENLTQILHFANVVSTGNSG